MRVFITGVTGFIGKKLAEHLVHAGIEVIGLSKHNLKSPLPYEVVVGDVLDTRIIEPIVNTVDCVVHLAAITTHNEIVNNRSRADEVNLLGTKNVLDSFNKSKRAIIFIYASTGKVYGRIQELPITEHHPTNPLNILGESKLETEQLIHNNCTSEKSYIILRIFNVYGEGQKENFLIPTIINQFKKRQKKIILGNVKVQRDYLYIDDVLSLIIRIINTESISTGLQKYNVCSGKPVSPQQIVGEIEKILGEKVEIETDKNRFRFDEEEIEYGSYKKTKDRFKWEPQVVLNEGLKKVLLENELL